MDSDFKPTSGGWVIVPVEKNPGGRGGDIHETFKVDNAGNVTGGHSTIQTPGLPPVRIPWSDK